ncbi:MAG: spore coat U domain-containing protein [Pseudomonadota bacterium]
MKPRWRIVGLLLAFAYAQASAGSCSLSVGAMAFAPYTSITTARAMSTDRTSDTTLTLTCTGIVRGGPYTISLLPDAAGGGAVRQVRHVGGHAPMAAVLYRDAGFMQPWGDGTGGTAPITGMLPPGDSRHTHVVFGRLAAGQRQLRAGAYLSNWAVRVDYTP